MNIKRLQPKCHVWLQSNVCNELYSGRIIMLQTVLGVL